MQDDELKQDVKEIKGRLTDIHMTLARNTESLIHHSARTYANEARISKVENWLLGILTSGLLGLLGLIFKKAL